jgi:hypothetical protein
MAFDSELNMSSSRKFKVTTFDYNVVTGYFTSYGLINVFVKNTASNSKYIKTDENLGEVTQTVAPFVDGVQETAPLSLTINFPGVGDVKYSIESASDFQGATVLTGGRSFNTYAKMYGSAVYYPSPEIIAIFK